MRTYTGYTGVTLRNAIKNGNTQHVAMIFDGPFGDILGDERVALDGGFSLNEIFNPDSNYTPGSTGSATFSATLLNSDGNLNNFDYARDFVLFVGVEADNGTDHGTAQNNAEVQITLDNGVLVWLNGDTVYVKTSARTTQYAPYHGFLALQGGSQTSIFLISNDTYQSKHYTSSVIRINSGSEATMYNIPRTFISDYAYNRITYLNEHGIAEVWNTSGNCSKYEIESTSGRHVTEHRIMYVGMATMTGKKPRRTLGEIVSFDAQDILWKLEKDASDYINAEWSGSKTLQTMTTEVLNAAGLTLYSFPSNLSSLQYSTNPFAGKGGLTYRDLLSLIGASVGMSFRLRDRAIGLDSQVGFTVTARCSVEFKTFPTNINYTFQQDEYYTYDAEEYSVQSIARIISRQTADDVGVQYPQDAENTANTYVFVDNPLLALDTIENIRNRLSYAYNNMSGYHSGSYRPCVIDAFSPLVVEPGDCISVYVDDNHVVETLVFAMTTTWNGSAECTIESTGEETINQYTNSEFQQKLQEGKKYHNLIVDLDQLVSEIADANGHINTLEQTAVSTLSKISAIGSPQILRGTNTLTELNVYSDGKDWEHELWTKRNSGTYALINVTDAPISSIGRGIRMTSGTVYQRHIPVTQGKAYTLSAYARCPSGSGYAYIGAVSDSSGEMTVGNLVGTEWTKIWTTYTANSNDAKVIFASTGDQIEICGMKLELGRTPTDWTEADSYAYSLVEQTADGIRTEVADEFGNYYTKSETATQISTSIGSALGNYYTKTETDQGISQSISDALGNYYTKTETSTMYSRLFSSTNSSQILRGTNKLSSLPVKGAANADWDHETWTQGTTSDRVGSVYTLVNISDPPCTGVTRGVRFTVPNTDQGTDFEIQQPGIRMVPGQYILSGWFRKVSGPSTMASVYLDGNGTSRTISSSEWTRVTRTVTYTNNNARTAKFGISKPSSSGTSVIEVCGMKLERGSTATDWSEADSYAYSQITQTQDSITTIIEDELGNYYTKSETASLISEEMSDALGNYYTKTQTASLIEEEMSDALGNYYTKTQTASEISTYVGSHAYGLISGITITAAGVDITGSKYVRIESNNAWVRLGDAQAGDLGIGLSLASRYQLSFVPAGGVRGWLKVDYDQDSAQQYSINLIPHAMYQSSGTLYEMGSSLGADADVTDHWVYGYIDNLVYVNAYENSSRDVKHDITDLPDMGSLIDQLRPVSFVYNQDKEEKTHYGLIHEETVGIMPVICKGTEYDDAKKKAIDYVEIVPVLLKEIQSLRARVLELEQKNGQNKGS